MLVSIIMNCKNASATLADSLASVLAQSYSDWEIIFWDNASQDNSFNIAEKYAKKYDNIHVFKSDKQVTLSHSRNDALNKCKGKYIAFLDCDDTWHKDKLRLQVQYMQENPQVNLLCTNTQTFCENRGKRHIIGNVFKQSPPMRGHVFQQLILIQWVILSSVMLRRSALDVLHQESYKEGNFESILQQRQSIKYFNIFDPRLQICGDADVFYRLAYEGICDFIPKILTYRRIHNNNMTFLQFEKLAEETSYILKKLNKIYPELSTEYPKVIDILNKRIAFQEAITFWRQGQSKKARKHIKLYRKNNIKIWLFTILTFFPKQSFIWGAKTYFRLPYSFRT